MSLFAVLAPITTAPALLESIQYTEYSGSLQLAPAPFFPEKGIIMRALFTILAPITTAPSLLESILYTEYSGSLELAPAPFFPEKDI